MAFSDQFKLAYKVMFKPNKTTFTDRPIGDMLKFYYKILAIPLIAFIILELVLYAYGLGSIGSPIFLGAQLTTIILFMLIGNLIAFFVWAVIIHLFGMALGQFKRSFDNTLTGVIYGAVPTALFIWVLALPIFGIYLFMLFALWGLIITIMAVANQQRISKKASLGVFIAIFIVLLLIVLIFGYLALSYFSGIGPGLVGLFGSTFSTASQKCITLNKSYSCSNVTIGSDGKLDVQITQNADYGVSNVWVGCLLNMQSSKEITTNPIVNQSNISGYNSGKVFTGNFAYGESLNLSGRQCYNLFNGTAITYLQPGSEAGGLLTIHYSQQSTNTVRLVYAVIKGKVTN